MLIITFLNRDAERLYMTVPPQPNLLTQQELQLFQRICQIQDKSGHIVRVPDDGITRKDEQAINELLQIFEYGQTSKKHNTVIVTGNRKMLEIMSDSFQSECNPINIRAVYPESFVKLFGDEVKTGHMIRTVTGKVEMSSSDIQGLLSILDEDEPIEVKIIDAEVIEEFPDITQRIRAAKRDPGAG